MGKIEYQTNFSHRSSMGWLLIVLFGIQDVLAPKEALMGKLI
jgi:hypothetical protein